MSLWKKLAIVLVNAGAASAGVLAPWLADTIANHPKLTIAFGITSNVLHWLFPSPLNRDHP